MTSGNVNIVLKEPRTLSKRESNSTEIEIKTKKRKINKRENRAVVPRDRFDRFDHFSLYDDKKSTSRCKNVTCAQQTHWYCSKCDVHLCLKSDRNCFYEFHHM